MLSPETGGPELEDQKRNPIVDERYHTHPEDPQYGEEREGIPGYGNAEEARDFAMSDSENDTIKEFGERGLSSAGNHLDIAAQGERIGAEIDDLKAAAREKASETVEARTPRYLKEQSVLAEHPGTGDISQGKISEIVVKPNWVEYTVVFGEGDGTRKANFKEEELLANNPES